VSYFGYSQLRLYQKCPRQYWFERVAKRQPPVSDQRNAFVGSLLGAVVAAFYTHRWWTAGGNARKLMAMEVYEASHRLHALQDYPWHRGELQEKLQTAQDTIPRILDVIVRERLIAARIDIELSVEVPLDTGDTLVGSPDLVLTDADGASTVIDVKAGATVGRYVSNDQLRLYKLGVGAATGRLPARAGFWWLRHSRIAWKRIPDSTLPKWVDGVKATIARLRSGDYAPTPSGLCRYCAFRAECPEGMEDLQVRKTILASDDAVSVVRL